MSENQYEAKFITTARPNAITRPPDPPSASPMTSSRPLIKPSSSAVFIPFMTLLSHGPSTHRGSWPDHSRREPGRPAAPPSRAAHPRTTCSCAACAPSPTAPRPSNVGTPREAVIFPSDAPPVAPSARSRPSSAATDRASSNRRRHGGGPFERRAIEPARSPEAGAGPPWPAARHEPRHPVRFGRRGDPGVDRRAGAGPARRSRGCRRRRGRRSASSPPPGPARDRSRAGGRTVRGSRWRPSPARCRRERRSPVTSTTNWPHPLRDVFSAPPGSDGSSTSTASDCRACSSISARDVSLPVSSSRRQQEGDVRLRRPDGAGAARQPPCRPYSARSRQHPDRDPGLHVEDARAEQPARRVPRAASCASWPTGHTVSKCPSRRIRGPSPSNSASRWSPAAALVVAAHRPPIADRRLARSVAATVDCRLVGRRRLETRRAPRWSRGASRRSDSQNASSCFIIGP